VAPILALAPLALAFVAFVSCHVKVRFLKDYNFISIVSPDCGDTVSENCTYLTETSITSVTGDQCSYTICKCSTDICRIRFDFNVKIVLFKVFTWHFLQTFDIASPETGTASAGTVATGNGQALGDCLTDQFSITAPGNLGSPVICGFNSGQHSKTLYLSLKHF